MREWIGDFSTDESERAGRLWSDVVGELHPLIQPDKLVVSVDIRRNIIAAITTNLWLKYETKKAFVPQLEKNFEAMKQALQNGILRETFELTT